MFTTLSLHHRPLLFALVAVLVTGCNGEEEQKAALPRPVRTVTAELSVSGQEVSLPGTIQAVNEVSTAFRLAGRMIERKLNVGDRVEAGQLVAILDSQNERNAQRSAEAGVRAGEGQLVQARNAFGRQQSLLNSGFSTRANFDQAQQLLQSAQAQLDDARAQLKIAQDRVSFTELVADAPGTVTAIGAEPGEVVQAGQMIVRLARQNGRDAVFDVPADLIQSLPADSIIDIRPLNSNDSPTEGRVREVSPQADPVTRTFQVKVGLINPPESLRLGMTVRGTVHGETLPHIVLPSSALTTTNGKTAVWVVNPQTLKVGLREVAVESFSAATASISEGLATGDVVVTAGVQALYPDQQVRLLEVQP
ncbi:efflux RND transporter periplasmic adaptor subunit [Brucellaceae bacterium D45D]